MLSLLAVVPAFGPSPSCAGANFTTLGKLDLTEFTRKTWYIQEQQIVGYQPLESLYCVAATYDLAGASVPFFSGTVATVYNYANQGAVNGPLQNANNFTLCARANNDDDSSKLSVAPCFLPNLFAGPYWVIGVGTAADGTYEWAVIIGGEPTEQYDDGCTTKESGTNGAGLWLFSRTSVAPKAQLDAMHQVLIEQGIARSRLHPVAQEGCRYTGAFIK